MGTLSTADEPTIGKFVPTDIEKELIIWRGNPAHMDGRLAEFELWLKRTGLFKMLLEHHAVLLPNGKTAIDHPAHIPFIEQKVPGAKEHGFENPCQSGLARVILHNIGKDADDQIAVYGPLS